MLKIENLTASIEDKVILKGFSLEIGPGEIHAIMGPNGAGKSTLAKVIAGDPSYEVTSGTITFEGKELDELEPEERSHLGLFMGFQYPLEIQGISNVQFLHAAYNAHQKAKGIEPITEEAFETYCDEMAEQMNIQKEFLSRSLNSGFSGGEKKRNEILQMAVLAPKLAVLDETDSGLDIDALRIVADGINRFASDDRSLLLITHYQRLLDYVKPHFVHIMVDGKIVRSGNHELAIELEKDGYGGAQCSKSFCKSSS